MKASPSAFRPFLYRTICGVLLCHSMPCAKAAEAGAWETFFSDSNAKAWTVFDFVDDGFYEPGWDDTNAGNEFIFFPHTGDAPLWFYTDSLAPTLAGQGALLGDYAAEKIQAVLCSMYIDSLVAFDFVDCVVDATGPLGPGFYYSESVAWNQLPDDGWHDLRFGFADTWYFYDNGYIPIRATAETFSSIVGLGFRFFPAEGTAATLIAAIDDVKLEPLVTAPALDVSLTATDFKLAFTPAKAVSCVIEQLISDPVVGWEAIPGQSGITGPNEHEFVTPIAGASGFFRVQAAADYTPFTTHPPIQP